MVKPSGKCPYCYIVMEVERMRCPECEVTVEGSFPVPLLMRLKPEQLDFVERFVIASGSLKEMAKEMGVSYPTVRNRLDGVIETLRGRQASEEERRSDIMDALEAGKISADEAAERIKGVR
jgi:hypothetical protein